MKTIRLTQKEIAAIKEAFILNFPAGDKLWIFGSRVYPEKRGGDIDLYVETTLSAQAAAKARVKFSVDIQFAIGEQRIDVIINRGTIKLPIYDVAQEEGVQLI